MPGPCRCARPDPRGICWWSPSATATRARWRSFRRAGRGYRKAGSCVTDFVFPRSNLKMIQSCTMKALKVAPLLAFAVMLPAVAADHKPPPVQPAMSFAAVDVHDKEKVAIAAEPYDTKEKESIFRVDYLGHGVMPVRLIVTNNGDRPISLRDARIMFQTPAGDRINAAEPEDVERLMTRKEREGRKIPLPGPIPNIHTKPKASNKDIEADFDEFEYGALVVEPHTTRAG